MFKQGAKFSGQDDSAEAIDLKDEDLATRDAQRLKVVESLQGFGDKAEAAFDLAAEAARRAVGADAGVVSLLCDQQVWFKGSSNGARTSLPLGEALCSLVVEASAPIFLCAVQGARQAGRGPVGAYAGVPIWVQGFVVGAIAVTWDRPQTFDASLGETLELYAAMVAERFESRREKVFLNKLFDAASDAVVIVDENQTITQWNSAAEAMLGYSFREALGQPLAMIIPPAMRAHHDRGFERVRHGARPTMQGAVDVPVLRRDGSEFPASLALSIWQDRGRTSVGAIIRDISEREALAQARSASEAKTRFLANMSHEIRTPLNGIIGLADVLSRTRLDEDQLDLLRSMRGAARTLEALLADVLDLARLEEGALRLLSEPFDLTETLRELVNLHRPAAEAKGLDLRVDAPSAPAWVCGDGARLRQVLGNLLSNSVKFTAKGAIVLCARPEQHGWRFEVIDTGIGFDDEARRRIFDRFTQADDSITRRFGGSGLGLSICLELVRAMGGELEVSSAVGEGSRFVFQLPLEQTLAPELPENDPSLIDRSAKVLLAEDHPVNRKVVEMILAEVGVDVVSVADGRQAVAAFASEPFDLVLMDMQMPVLDGLTATREIRALERGAGRRACPIIMLTANVLPEHARAAFEAGADRHLPKPIEAQSLLMAIDESISGYDAEAAR